MARCKEGAAQELVSTASPVGPSCRWRFRSRMFALYFTLCRLYTNALRDDFNGLCISHGPTLVAEPRYQNGCWVSALCSKYLEAKARIYSPLESLHLCRELTSALAPPTQGRVYQRLCQQEYIAELAGSAISGSSQFVNIRIRIEADQYGVNYVIFECVIEHHPGCELRPWHKRRTGRMPRNDH